MTDYPSLLNSMQSVTIGYNCWLKITQLPNPWWPLQKLTQFSQKKIKWLIQVIFQKTLGHTIKGFNRNVPILAECIYLFCDILYKKNWHIKWNIDIILTLLDEHPFQVF